MPFPYPFGIFSKKGGGGLASVLRTFANPPSSPELLRRYSLCIQTGNSWYESKFGVDTGFLCGYTDRKQKGITRMATIKTAISIREPLFEQVESLANELNISRSRVFVLAVEEFVQRYNNRQLLDDINRAYDDLPNRDEQLYLDKTRRQHKRLVEGEW